jgi:hypothetical protein
MRISHRFWKKKAGETLVERQSSRFMTCNITVDVSIGSDRRTFLSEISTESWR